jgi:predicted MFS family arabinose efflux permease
LSLGALLGAMFLANVDVAIANIAAPSIAAGLRASGGELELIVSGYTLAYSVLLVTSARLGQARGYRPMFLAGLGGFTVASAACAFAPDAPFLVLARLAAGATAALMTAQVLTGIQTEFTGRARARAIGLYTAVLSAGAVAGQSLGGLLISADVLGMTWRPVFLINLPLGVVLLWLAWRYLPAGNSSAGDLPAAGNARPGAGGSLDLPGVAALSVAMLLLVLPLVLGQDAGWPTWTWLSLAASAVAFGVLWVVERKTATAGQRPLVDPRLLARPAIGWGLASQAVTTGTYFAILFTLALYLQQGLGKSPAYSGLALLSWVAAFGVPGPVLGKLGQRARALAAPAGAVLLAAGFAAIGVSLLRRDTNGALLMTLLGVSGLGLGAGFTGTLGHLTSSVTTRQAADISGLFNTATRAGGVVGTAAFGSLYLALVPAGAHSPVTATHGFALLNLALAGAAATAAIMAWIAVLTQLRPGPVTRPRKRRSGRSG